MRYIDFLINEIEKDYSCYIADSKISDEDILNNFEHIVKNNYNIEWLNIFQYRKYLSSAFIIKIIQKYSDYFDTLNIDKMEKIEKIAYIFDFYSYIGIYYLTDISQNNFKNTKSTMFKSSNYLKTIIPFKTPPELQKKLDEYELGCNKNININNIKYIMDKNLSNNHILFLLNNGHLTLDVYNYIKNYKRKNNIFYNFYNFISRNEKLDINYKLYFRSSKYATLKQLKCLYTQNEIIELLTNYQYFFHFITNKSISLQDIINNFYDILINFIYNGYCCINKNITIEFLKEHFIEHLNRFKLCFTYDTYLNNYNLKKYFNHNYFIQIEKIKNINEIRKELELNTKYPFKQFY